MKTESVAISSLSFDPANARKHGAKNIDAVKGSLARFGQQKPIVVGKNGVVIAGNGTLEAATALGWERIEIVRTDLEGPDAVAFALADNRTSELAEWDDEILGRTLASLREIDFDLTAIGFDTSYLDTLNAVRPDAEGSSELDPENFSEFSQRCPRCSFEFDGKPES